MEIIKLNLIPSGATPVVHVKQYDVGRTWRFELYEGASVYTLDGTETIEIDVKKNDGNVVTVAVANTSDNYVDIATTPQMTACSGDQLGAIKFTKGGDEIATLNFILACQRSPLENGIQSDSAIHNLEQQIADAVADQYDADSVIFDNTPTTGHGIGYAVTSDGLKSYIPKNVSDMDDVTITTPVAGEALVFDADGNLVNGTVSTVGNLDDLSDVDTTGKAVGDSLRYDGAEWIAQPCTVALTQAEYDALQLSGDLVPNTHYVITDAPNLNPTASDIEYSGGVTVKQAIDGKQDTLTVSSDAVTWNTTNVTGGTEIKYWFKYGRIVIGHLEFTPKSGRISNGNVICSGLPKPNSGYNCFGDNKQQFIIDNNGNLTWYFPTDTTTLNRWDLNITYISQS